MEPCCARFYMLNGAGAILGVMFLGYLTEIEPADLSTSLLLDER